MTDSAQNNDSIPLLLEASQRSSQIGGQLKQELELALTVLLVDIASIDQNFDMNEYNVIAAGLSRLFGTTPQEVQALVNQANLVLKNLRGTSKYAEILKENLSSEERRKILEVIDDVISADGVEDGYETYLRHKFSDILDVTAEEQVVIPQAEEA